METLLQAGLSNAVTATFLAVLVACLGRALARRPAVLHCLWLLVLLKLVTPPLYKVPIPWPKPFAGLEEQAAPPDPVCLERTAGIGRSVPSGPGATMEPALPTGEIIVELLPVDARLAIGSQSKPAVDSFVGWLPFDWMPLAAMIWLAGTAAVLVVSAKRVRQFQLLLREARPVSEETQDWVNELAFSLGLFRPPSVWWIGGKLSPLVWALGWRPRLIIPTDLWKSLDDHQRSTLIVHELAHLRRGDHRVRIFELLVTALFWWHPVLWWVRQALRDVEEQCCDAWVVWAFPDSAKSYAETLLETLDFLNQSDRPVPLLASGFGKVNHLRRRLTMIMSGTTPRLLGIRGTLGALGLAALLLPVNATWAQKPVQEKQATLVVKTVDDPGPGEFAVTVDDPVQIIRDDTRLSIRDLNLTSDEPTSVEAQVVRQPNFVRLEVTTDDSSIKVTADTMEEALAKLKEQIKTLSKKASPSDQEKAKNALEDVVKQLEKQLKDTTDARSRVVRVKPFQVRVQDDNPDRKISPETKAEIAKLRANVKELTQAVQTKQKELMAAQAKLSQLEGRPHAVKFFSYSGDPQQATSVVRVPEVTHTAPVRAYVLRREDIKGPTKPGEKPTLHQEYVITNRVDTKAAGDVDQGKLAELEKKLQELLAEVASLKKDRAK